MGRYVVIDLEMCRVPKRFRKAYMHSMETIQIGAAVLDENFHIVKTYSRYVKPQVGMLDSTIARLTGIEGADLYNADSFDVVLRDFSNWLPDECIMISWSLTDLSQLQKEMLYKGVTDEKIESLFDTWVDAQVIFSEKIDNEKNYSLEEALNLTDVSVIGSMHDGLSDAINTAKLYAKMMTEETMRFNEYYLKAKDEVEHLSFSMGDLFSGFLQLQA